MAKKDSCGTSLTAVDELTAFTRGYRERMDALMGFTGTEAERQAQCIARWRVAA